ncbi:MAG TPA: DUF4386 family protein [Candidatus Cybelea sp.]|nr:DUF4386 family protein [Candidatus Cybelea sp.]
MTPSKARVTGAVYLLYFLLVISAASSVGRVPVAFSDAANLVANAVYVTVSLLLYQLLKPVDRNVALLAVTISAIGCTVQSLALFHLVQAQSALPIFGLFNITIGYLVIRSTFLPRVLGILMALSGVGWLMVLSPELVKHADAYIEVVGVVAEGCLMLWLLIMGVNVQSWNEQAAAAGRPRLRSG